MSAAESHFAASYAEARHLFLGACRAAGLPVQSHVHPLRGRDGEELAMDVARLGSADATSLLMVSSACHGVEGYCGSGVQHALLSDADFLSELQRKGTALLLVHALNPYGFSWLRRVTHENVDLNRNWHDFSAALPANPGYEQLAERLLPDQWPPTPANEAALAAWMLHHGERAFQAAVSQGQYTHPQGLFYGGTAPTWSQQTLRQVLREHGRRCNRLGWIDVHTGLGPSGHGEKIFAGDNDAVAITRAKRWWGSDVTSTFDGSSSSAPLVGLLHNVMAWECPQARYTGIALEYGTQPMAAVILALRADHWLANHPEAPQEQRRAIGQQMRDAFYVDSPQWKQAIVEQGLAACRQAIVGLNASD
jgi:predicted deacylase